MLHKFFLRLLIISLFITISSCTGCEWYSRDTVFNNNDYEQVKELNNYLQLITQEIEKVRKKRKLLDSRVFLHSYIGIENDTLKLKFSTSINLNNSPIVVTPKSPNQLIASKNMLDRKLKEYQLLLEEIYSLENTITRMQNENSKYNQNNQGQNNQSQKEASLLLEYRKKVHIKYEQVIQLEKEIKKLRESIEVHTNQSPTGLLFNNNYQVITTQGKVKLHSVVGYPPGEYDPNSSYAMLATLSVIKEFFAKFWKEKSLLERLFAKTDKKYIRYIGTADAIPIYGCLHYADEQPNYGIFPQTLGSQSIEQYNSKIDKGFMPTRLKPYECISNSQLAFLRSFGVAKLLYHEVIELHRKEPIFQFETKVEKSLVGSKYRRVDIEVVAY